MIDKKYYVYLLKCRDDSLYCGYTINLEKRVATHNNKTGAKYTRARTPVESVYYEIFNTKSESFKKRMCYKKFK
ncbi:endo/exonuclease amino terminal GIY-YIG domain protein [Peptoniphilus indolicus ATCC 29427]|uniref:Endo/exonuclease amino terminal GIY-YIG domain protein n=1 Tax=Peptoniphilus indolicus ATCC 29427 TaxID=997350 RepID=G4D4B2_9FIRM|nr:GIY-YIG nuclease family protein [Peptoniphilus indolicus]EGY79626.1 endo/exonuclease amino terminal GIY-YIG domain protein [Peptoniphilus indolicus ATCC 29427]